MAKTNKKLLGVTLIELIVTMAIVVILAGVSIANMRGSRRSKNLVDDTTDLIVTALNQANATSIASGTTNPAKVCHIIAGTGNNRADCDPDLTRTTWQNVNGVKFNARVTVNITGGPVITYTNGLITSGSSNDAAFTITVTATDSDTSCTNTSIPSNTIKLWQNGVVDVTKLC